jgi:hypothetical protein
VEFSGPLKVLYDDACRTYVWRNPAWPELGGIWRHTCRSVTLGWEMLWADSRVDIFPFNRNQLPEYEYSPGRVHIHNEVTEAELVLRVTSETREALQTPSPVSTSRRSIEGVSLIFNTLQTRKEKQAYSMCYRF